MLHVNDDNKNFEYKHTLPYEHKKYLEKILSKNRGYKLAILNPNVETIADIRLYENQLKFAENQQVLLIDFS